MGAAPAHDFLNPRQHRAVVCREVSVVLSSGAGCGKTHVLTARYLSHLESDEAEPGQIVAITFTDRAARQMRERILLSLTRKVKEAAADDEAERWARHLQGLETAPISTIHGFCAALLRQNAVEAGLDPRFTVLEDVLSVNFENDALMECLQRLLTGDTLPAKDLRDLILLYGWKPTLEGVRALMQSEDERAWKAWLERPVDKIAGDWQRFARQDFLPPYVAHLVKTSPKVARCLELLRKTKPRPGSRMAENVRNLLEKLPRLAEAVDVAAAVKELTELAKVGGEKAKAWSSEEDYQAVKAAFEGFRKELPERMQMFLSEPEDLDEAAAVGQRFVRVASEAAHAYQALKRRNGVVDFQDLLVLARDLLRDRPEVRERLQRRYRFLLIDELQDTDPVQMELVENLAGAGLTQGKLFAVGDSKQSIYRFRGADVHRFQFLRQQVPHEGRMGLTVNYRSQPAILDFTNALLAPYLEDYEPLEPHHSQVNPGPCVEFLWSPRGEKEYVSEGRAREADWIARRIAAMVEDREELVVDRNSGRPRLRPVQQGDIALLFRSMSNVHLYEAALRNQGLDYYLVGGRAFFAQQEIYDLLNLLKALENPFDSLSLAGTLRSPFCCLSDDALLLLGRHPEGLWRGLNDPATLLSLPAEQRETACRAQTCLNRWHALKDRLSIARLLGEVFADSAYDAAIQFEFLGDRKLANLWKMVDLARAFDRSGLFGLAEFIQRLGDLVKNQPREEQAATQPENADVVRLMTIHQAKGLEFPVVFIPDFAAQAGGGHFPVAHWDARLGCVCRPPAEEPSPFPDFPWRLWLATEAVEDWREDLRTLYVACTRAEDYLVLSAALSKPVNPSNTWMTALADRFDPGTGACRDASIPGARSPRVRVTEDQPSRTGQGKRLRKQQPASLTPVDWSPEGVGPVALRLAGDELITVAEVEGFLRRRARDQDPNDCFLRPPQVAFQFDAEDGSDRTTWRGPRERIDPGDNSEAGSPGTMIRAVLEQWDFQDPDGWRPLLAEAQIVDTFRGSGLPGEGNLEELFTQFAGSATYRMLSQAQVVYRELEFFLALGQGGSLAGSEAAGGETLRFRGVIDCLWQDGDGDWHLLYYVTHGEVGDELKDSWQNRQVGMALAARAVRQNLGRWPKEVGLYSFPQGQAVFRSTKGLRQRKLQDFIATGIRDFLGQPLSGC